MLKKEKVETVEAMGGLQQGDGQQVSKLLCVDAEFFIERGDRAVHSKARGSPSATTDATLACGQSPRTISSRCFLAYSSATPFLSFANRHFP